MISPTVKNIIFVIPSTRPYQPWTIFKASALVQKCAGAFCFSALTAFCCEKERSSVHKNLGYVPPADDPDLMFFEGKGRAEGGLPTLPQVIAQSLCSAFVSAF